jgi:hypothetical protein
MGGLDGKKAKNAQDNDEWVVVEINLMMDRWID